MIISTHYIGNCALHILFSNDVFSVWSTDDPTNPEFIGSYNDCISYVNDAISYYINDCIQN